MRAVFAALFLAVTAAHASAQDFKAGLEAYDRGDFETVLKEWVPLAEQGDARAQFNLGVIYFNGQGVPHDPVKAVDWYRAAADQGYAPAQVNLSFMYETGQGVLQNYIQAYKWATIAEKHGADAAAASRESLAGKMTAEQIAEATREAEAWRPRFAEGSTPETRGEVTRPAAAPSQVPTAPPTREQIREVQILLRELGFDAGPPDGIAGPRTRTAVSQFQDQRGLAVTGEITADLIAQLTERESADDPAGPNEQVAAPRVTEDPPAAAAPAAAAPEADDRPLEAADCDRSAAHPADAQLPPGVSGVAFDDIDADRAIQACELALAQNAGVARYQFQLGRSLHRAERYEEAVTYYQQAGLQGHVLAQKSLGFSYSNGLGVSQDYTKAAQWHHMAADQGDSDAQHNLGFLYAGGWGVEPDFIQAHMWYNIAAAHGSAGAAKKRDLLAGRMTNQQIAEAERRALAWFDLHPGSAKSQ